MEKNMEALALFEALDVKPTPRPEAPQLDNELWQELKSMPISDKAIKAEIEFLEAYVQAHGFALDQCRLQTLKAFLQTSQAAA